MKKKLFIFSALIFFIALSINFLSKTKRMVSIYEIGSTSEKIEVTGKVKGYLSAEINIKNNSELVFNHGENIRYEFIEDYRIVDILPFDWGHNDILHLIQPGQTYRTTFDVGQLYGNRKLPYGKYKVTLPGNFEDSSEKIEIYVIFEVTIK